MAENLVLMLAQRHVRRYADELNTRRAAPIECRDCEVFLQHGIDAFKWLRRAEETMRQADYEGLFTFSREMQEALHALYQMWLTSCETAEGSIMELLGRGCQPDNLGEFRRACGMVRDTIERRDWQNLATYSRVLAEVDEPW